MTGVPKHYQKLRKQFGQVMDNLESLGKSIRQAGPIQEKEVQLIQLAAAAAQKSEGAVHSHVSRAIEAGASPEEVRHALMLLVSTIGYPSVAAALSWADDILD